jgi:hypothetical protein
VPAAASVPSPASRHDAHIQPEIDKYQYQACAEQADFQQPQRPENMGKFNSGEPQISSQQIGQEQQTDDNGNGQQIEPALKC